MGGNLGREVEIAIGIKEAIGDERVNVRVKIQVFAKGVQGEEEGGDALGEVEGGAEEFGDGLLGEGAQPLQEAAMALEVRSEKFGQGQDDMAVGNGKQDVIDKVCRGALDFALMAGRTEPSALAREGQQVFVLAMIAADTCETTFESATVDELFKDLGEDGPKGAVLRFVRIGVDGDEGLVMTVDALPQRGLSGIPGPVGLHVQNGSGGKRPFSGKEFLGFSQPAVGECVESSRC